MASGVELAIQSAASAAVISSVAPEVLLGADRPEVRPAA